jgi:sporulation protein YtfJ
MEHETPIKELLNTALRDARTVMDTDTVVGDPICLDNGLTIIPLSKVAMGFASGGLDFPSNRSASKNFGGGGGTGVTVTPIGFLTIYPEGRVEVIPVAPTEMGPVEQIADMIGRAPEIINRIRAVISGEGLDETGSMEELIFDAMGEDKKSRKKRK